MDQQPQPIEQPQNEIPQTPPVTPTPVPVMPQPQKSNTGLIIGIVAGVVVLLAVVGLIAAFYMGVFGKATQNSQKNQPTSQNTSTTTTTKSTADTSSCVTAADLEKAFKVQTDQKDFDSMNYLYGTSIFFEADSTADSFPDQVGEEYDKFAQFYKDNSTKQFAIHLTASTYEASTSDAGTKLATERVNKVKDALTSRGVPSDRIVIETPRVSTYDPESTRNVDVSMEKSGSCARVY